MVVIYDGCMVEVVNQFGCFGLECLINMVQCKCKDNGVFELLWINDGVMVVVNFKIISSVEVFGNSNGVVCGMVVLCGLKLLEIIVGGVLEVLMFVLVQVLMLVLVIVFVGVLVV